LNRTEAALTRRLGFVVTVVKEKQCAELGSFEREVRDGILFVLVTVPDGAVQRRVVIEVAENHWSPEVDRPAAPTGLQAPRSSRRLTIRGTSTTLETKRVQ
jgi:hypothetical protein